MSNGLLRFYMPYESIGCYDCIVTSNKVRLPDDRDEGALGNNSTTATDITEYVRTVVIPRNADLVKKYYTALGRERQGLYRATK